MNAMTLTGTRRRELAGGVVVHDHAPVAWGLLESAEAAWSKLAAEDRDALAQRFADEKSPHIVICEAWHKGSGAHPVVSAERGGTRVRLYAVAVGSMSRATREATIAAEFCAILRPRSKTRERLHHGGAAPASSEQLLAAAERLLADHPDRAAVAMYVERALATVGCDEARLAAAVREAEGILAVARGERGADDDDDDDLLDDGIDAAESDGEDDDEDLPDDDDDDEISEAIANYGRDKDEGLIELPEALASYSPSADDDEFEIPAALASYGTKKP